MQVKIQDAHPELQLRLSAMMVKCAAKGIPVTFTCILRSRFEQLAYASVGRTFDELYTLLKKYEWTKSMQRITDLKTQGLDMVHIRQELYKLAGHSPSEIGDKKITWTMNSRHLPTATGKSLACDFAVGTAKKLEWSPKVDINKDGEADYQQVGKIAESCDLVWGGRWSTPDLPHVELPKKFWVV